MNRDLARVLKLKVKIADSKALQAIPVENLTAYLEAYGWYRDHRAQKDESIAAFIWKQNGFPNSNLLVGEDPELSDYGLVCARIIEVMANKYNQNCSELQVWWDIMHIKDAIKE